MENITFYKQINLFWKVKGQGNPQPAYAGLMHAYAGTNLCAQLGFQKPMKNKFFALILRFGMNFTSFGSRSKPLFSHYIKPDRAPLQNTENLKGKLKIH